MFGSMLAVGAIGAVVAQPKGALANLVIVSRSRHPIHLFGYAQSNPYLHRHFPSRHRSSSSLWSVFDRDSDWAPFIS